MPPAACHRVPPCAAERHRAPQSAAERHNSCHRAPSSATECRRVPDAADRHEHRARANEWHDAYEALSVLRATTSFTSPTATARHRECNRRLPSFAARHGISCRVPPGATDRHQVPPRAHTARHRVPLSGVTACQRVPTRSTAYRRAPPTTEWHRVAPRPPSDMKLSTFALSGAQFSRATELHRAPRAMPANTDLTLICAGALQEQHRCKNSSIAMTAAHDSKLGSKLIHPITVEC
jgi:hypothetical protein